MINVNVKLLTKSMKKENQEFLLVPMVMTYQRKLKSIKIWSINYKLNLLKMVLLMVMPMVPPIMLNQLL